MTKKLSLTLTVASLCLIPLIGALANDIEPGKEFYTAVKARNPIVLDGDLSEWTGFAQLLRDPTFLIPKGSGDDGELVLFEEYDGGIFHRPAHMAGDYGRLSRL